MENKEREKSQANEKQRCENKRKRAHDVFSNGGQRKTSESIKMKIKKSGYVASFWAIRSLRGGGNATAMAMVGVMIHCGKAKNSHADKSNYCEYRNYRFHEFILIYQAGFYNCPLTPSPVNLIGDTVVSPYYKLINFLKSQRGINLWLINELNIVLSTQLYNWIKL